jgi:hypothetical protein
MKRMKTYIGVLQPRWYKVEVKRRRRRMKESLTMYVAPHGNQSPILFRCICPSSLCDSFCVAHASFFALHSHLSLF